MPLALFGTFGMQELLVIAGIIVLLFGAKKIPQLMTGLGEGVRGLRQAAKELEEEPDAHRAKEKRGS